MIENRTIPYPVVVVDQSRTELDFIQENFSLIAKICLRYKKVGSMLGYEFSDLTQIGIMAVLKAYPNIDWSNGNPISYLVQTIRGTIMNDFRDRGGLVKYGRRDSMRIASQYKIVHDEDGDTFKSENIINSMGGEPGASRNKSSQDGPFDPSLQIPLSLDSPVNNTDQEGASSNSRGDSIEDKTDFYGVLIEKLDIESSLKQLPEILRKVIELYYFENRKQSEIASQIGVTQTHVARLLIKARGLLAEQISIKSHKAE